MSAGCGIYHARVARCSREDSAVAGALRTSFDSIGPTGEDRCVGRRGVSSRALPGRTWAPLLLFCGGVVVAWFVLRDEGLKTSELIAAIGVTATICGWIGLYVERRLDAIGVAEETGPIAPRLSPGV